MKRIDSNILVIGCGTWPTTIAKILAENGHPVRIWCHRDAIIREINGSHTHQKVLPGVTLPEGLVAVSDLQSELQQCSAVVVGLASSYLYQVQTNGVLDVPVLSLTKGFLPEPYIRVSEYLVQHFHRSKIAVLSGPNLAKEIANKQLSATVIASESIEIASFFQKQLSNNYFRAYTSLDVPGVELGGVLKNIMAIAAGISDGMSLGSNAKAALVSRGLREMIRLSESFGAKPETLFGLSGLGDLIATCDSVQSRNYRVGLGLAQGKSLETILEELGQHAEGVNTTKQVMSYANHHHIEMPMTSAVYDVLFSKVTIKQALETLMNRELKAE